MRNWLCFLLAMSVGLLAAGCRGPRANPAQRAAPPIFEAASDVGNPARHGHVEHPAGSSIYRVAGGGANIWSTNDSFYYVWKRASGDVALAADISFISRGGNPHRKACLMLRQSLAPDSVYADAALHGNGLTSLQFRQIQGGLTRELQLEIAAPRRLRIEKRGDAISVAAATADAPNTAEAGPISISLRDPFYVGLAVSAHDDQAMAEVSFTRVALDPKK